MAYVAMIGRNGEEFLEIQRMIAEFGYEVSNILTPDINVLNNFSLKKPDLCLLDLSTGEYPEIIDLAKKISASRDISVLFNTGAQTDITLVRSALMTNPVGFIVYPVEPLQLRLNIETALMRQIEKQALLESEEKYRAIVENTRDAIYIYRNNRLIYVNGRLTDLLGYTRDELLGKPFIDVFHPDDRERVTGYALQRVRREEVPDVYEARVVTKTGDTKIFLFKPSAITLSGEYAVLGAATDITSQKEYENALIESEKKYRSVIENINDVFYRSDPAGNIIMTSPSGPALFGYSSVDEVIGLPLEQLWEDPRGRHSLIDQMKGKGAVNDVEIVLLKKDGSPISISLSAHFLYDEYGTFLGTEGIIRDISERKLAEEKLRKSEERMRRILESTNDGYYEWNMVTGEVFINNRYVEVFGYAKGELPEAFEEWRRHVHPDDIGPVMELLTDTIEGKTENYSAEYRMLSKTGEWLWISDKGRVVERDKEGNPVRFAGVHRDINEKKNAEAALRASEEKYRKIFNNVQDVFYQTDMNGIITEISPAIERHSGYTREELIGKPVNMVYDIKSERDTLVDVLLEQGEVFDYELNLRGKTGNLIYTSANVHLLFDEQGVLLGIEGSLRDITERREIEEALRQSEERLTLAIESVKGGILDWYVPDDHQIVNRELCDILGYHEGELTGSINNIVSLLHPDDSEYAQSEFNKCVEGATPFFSFECRLRARDGRWIWLQDTGKVVTRGKDGAPVRVIGIMLDITERKEIEQALRESEQRLRTLINAMPDIVCFKDGKGRWLEANDYDLKLFQLENVDYRGKRDSELADYSDFYHDAFLTCEETDEIAWRTPEFSRGIEAIPRPEGEPFIFDIIKVPTFEPDGTRKGLVVVGRDITELKRTEEQLKSSLIEKEVLLREVHHRVKNNFQVITSLLSLQSVTISDRLQIQQFNEIKSRIRSMALIHEKLYQSEDMAHIDFSSYIKSIANELHGNYYSTPDAPGLAINCDDISLTIDQAIPCGLIINELLTNIMKYAFPAGFYGEKTIHISFHEFIKCRPVLTVRDTGAGIPERIDFETNESLGLTLVRMLTRQLQGEVVLNREKGTEFIISFIRK